MELPKFIYNPGAAADFNCGRQSGCKRTDEPWHTVICITAYCLFVRTIRGYCHGTGRSYEPESKILNVPENL